MGTLKMMTNRVPNMMMASSNMNASAIAYASQNLFTLPRASETSPHYRLLTANNMEYSVRRDSIRGSSGPGDSTAFIESYARNDFLSNQLGQDKQLRYSAQGRKKP